MSAQLGKKESLWFLIVSPTIWGVHFLLCYITAAIWCAKFAPAGGSLGPVRMLIGLYTMVALIVIGGCGWHAWRRYRFGRQPVPFDADTPEDRHRFLGFATLLLAALSAVAVIFAALVAVFFEDCR
jgi:hypothetical protein